MTIWCAVPAGRRYLSSRWLTGQLALYIKLDAPAHRARKLLLGRNDQLSRLRVLRPGIEAEEHGWLEHGDDRVDGVLHTQSSW